MRSIAIGSNRFAGNDSGSGTFIIDRRRHFLYTKIEGSAIEAEEGAPKPEIISSACSQYIYDQETSACRYKVIADDGTDRCRASAVQSKANIAFSSGAIVDYIAEPQQN